MTRMGCMEMDPTPASLRGRIRHWLKRRYAFSFNRDRVGIRSKAFCFVWYVQRSTLEVWLFKWLVIDRTSAGKKRETQ